MKKTTLTTVLAAGSFAVLGLAGCAAQSDASGQAAAGDATGSSAPAAASTPAASSAGSSSAASASAYKDGVYTATGQYQSPGGTGAVAVALTLRSDVVTALKVTPKAEDPTSQQYEGKFASGVNALVIGKKLSELNVTTVSGSSLTSQGFDAAIDVIEGRAKA